MSLLNEKNLDLIEKESVTPVIQAASDIEVVDQISLEAGVSFLQRIKTVGEIVDGEFSPAVKAANETHKALLFLRKRFDEPLKQAESVVKDKITTYALKAKKLEKVDGLSLREKNVHDFSTVNVGKIIKLIQQGKLPEIILTIDEKHAKKLLDAGIDIPGAKVTPSKTVVIRA